MTRTEIKAASAVGLVLVIAIAGLIAGGVFSSRDCVATVGVLEQHTAECDAVTTIIAEADGTSTIGSTGEEVSVRPFRLPAAFESGFAGQVTANCRDREAGGYLEIGELETEPRGGSADITRSFLRTDGCGTFDTAFPVTARTVAAASPNIISVEAVVLTQAFRSAASAQRVFLAETATGIVVRAGAQLATQQEFNDGSTTTAATPAQVLAAVQSVNPGNIPVNLAARLEAAETAAEAAQTTADAAQADVDALEIRVDGLPTSTAAPTQEQVNAAVDRYPQTRAVSYLQRLIQPGEFNDGGGARVSGTPIAAYPYITERTTLDLRTTATGAIAAGGTRTGAGEVTWRLWEGMTPEGQTLYSGVPFITDVEGELRVAERTSGQFSDLELIFRFTHFCGTPRQFTSERTQTYTVFGNAVNQNFTIGLGGFSSSVVLDFPAPLTERQPICIDLVARFTLSETTTRPAGQAAASVVLDEFALNRAGITFWQINPSRVGPQGPQGEPGQDGAGGGLDERVANLLQGEILSVAVRTTALEETVTTLREADSAILDRLAHLPQGGFHPSHAAEELLDGLTRHEDSGLAWRVTAPAGVDVARIGAAYWNEDRRQDPFPPADEPYTDVKYEVHRGTPLQQVNYFGDNTGWNGYRSVALRDTRIRGLDVDTANPRALVKFDTLNVTPARDISGDVDIARFSTAHPFLRRDSLGYYMPGPDSGGGRRVEHRLYLTSAHDSHDLFEPSIDPTNHDDQTLRWAFSFYPADAASPAGEMLVDVALNGQVIRRGHATERTAADLGLSPELIDNAHGSAGFRVQTAGNIIFAAHMEWLQPAGSLTQAEFAGIAAARNLGGGIWELTANAPVYQINGQLEAEDADGNLFRITRGPVRYVELATAPGTFTVPAGVETLRVVGREAEGIRLEGTVTLRYAGTAAEFVALDTHNPGADNSQNPGHCACISVRWINETARTFSVTLAGPAGGTALTALLGIGYEAK